MCPGTNPGVRGRRPKISPRRVKGEGVGKGKEDLAVGEGRAEAVDDCGKRVVAASTSQQRCQNQVEEKREEQREQQEKEQQQQQMHEEQRLLQQQHRHHQQESVHMSLHQQMFLQQHQHQAFMQQQHPVMGNPSLGFDGDGGPVPRVQSLNTLPANPPISGSLSVQVQYRRGYFHGLKISLLPL